MADEVARLVAVMETQLRGFTKGMEQASREADRRFGQMERRMTQTERRFQGGFAALGGLATRFLSVAAITAFTRSLINTADRLADTAAQIGITTQQLQEFQYAARATGGNAEQMANALGLLNDRLGDAAKGEGELAELMREFNIPMGDAVQVLNDFADVTQKVATQSDKARIATALFGRAGKDNITFLEQGSQGLSDLAAEAHKLNQVWDAETLARLDGMNESLNNLSAAFTSIAAGPIAAFAQGLADIFNYLNGPDSLITKLDTLGKVIYNITPGGIAQRVTTGRFPFHANDGRGGQAPTDPLALSANDLAALAQGTPGRAAVPAKPGGRKITEDEKRRKALEFMGLPDLGSQDFWNDLQEISERELTGWSEYMRRLQSGAPVIDAVNWARGAAANDGAVAGPVQLPDAQIGIGDAIADSADVAIDEFDRVFTEFQQAGVDSVYALEDAFLRFAETGKLSIASLAQAILMEFTQAAIRDSITGPLMGLFDGRASGGPVKAGQPYIVGEKRPELFVPDTNGTILPRIPTPHSRAGGGSIVISQTFSFDGAVGLDGVHQIAQQHAAAASVAVTKAIRQAFPGMMVTAQKRNF